MDKALACKVGDWDSNPDKTKEGYFFLEKIKYVLLSPQVLNHVCSLLLAGSFENSGLTCLGEDKERVKGKTLSAPSVGAKLRREYNVLERGKIVISQDEPMEL